SHSGKDTEGKEFLGRVFAGTPVRAVFEEYDKLMDQRSVNHNRISADIRASACVFVLLDPHAEKLNHTRDWIAWECGVASAAEKTIWVFARQKHLYQITIVTPHVQQLVRYSTYDLWYSYVRAIVESYDNSAVTRNTLGGSAFAGIIADEENKIAAMAIGAL